MKKNTNTNSATTTPKDYSRILYRVINQISQKFSLTSETKKQITDFVKEKINGEIKTVFPKQLPDKNHFEMCKFSTGDGMLILMYGNNPDDKENCPNILYAYLQETTKEETEMQICEELSFTEKNSILTATLNRLKNHLAGCVGAKLDTLAQTQIYNFLIAHPITGGIGVLFTPKLPDCGYGGTVVQLNNGELGLVYGINSVKNKYPNVLWVNFRTEEERERRNLKKMKEDKFLEFWEARKLPQELFSEVVKNVDLSYRVTIVAYSSANDWNSTRKLNNKPVIFIGQKPNENNEFSVDIPIGYIDGNNVVIASPEFSFKLGTYEFK